MGERFPVCLISGLYSARDPHWTFTISHIQSVYSIVDWSKDMLALMWSIKLLKIHSLTKLYICQIIWEDYL